MHVVSIYTNKGGDGKSTVTVGLAEYLSGNRDRNVLVIDLDAQASATSAILGRGAKRAAAKSGKTSLALMRELIETKVPLRNLERFITCRPAASGRSGSALGEISVMLPTGPDIDEIEDMLNKMRHAKLFQRYLKPALKKQGFDYVLIDLPSNVRPKRDKICMNALVMSDFALVPVKATEMSLDGMETTFKNIEWAQKASRQRTPATLGFLLNATDRRFKQFKATFPPILDQSKDGNLPPVLDVVWPHSAAFQNATAHNEDVSTLTEKFGAAHKQARLTTIEFERLCNGFDPEQQPKDVMRALERIDVI
ncbi:MAG: ParA family protein [Planctomycetaceae bacterium]|nr:ParA family protein [Planctomycetaceae bacterium]